MRTFSPKTTDPDSWKRWLWHDGTLLMRRAWPWIVAWALMALGLVWGATQRPGTELLLVALSPFFQGAILVILDRARADTLDEGGVFLDVWNHMEQHAKRYAVWGLKRAVFALLALSVVMALMVGAAMLAANGVPPDSVPTTDVQPERLWGLTWSSWAWAWWIPACWQSGGMLSFRHWLWIRHEAPEQVVGSLNRHALLVNRIPIMITTMSVCVVTLLAMLLCPWILALLEWWWCAANHCAYHDIFDEGDGIVTRVRAGAMVAA